MNTDHLSREEIRLNAQNAIRDYLAEKNEQHKPIKNKKKIYDDLTEEGKTFGLSASTFYRYLSDMGCEKMGHGYYTLDNNATSLSNILRPRKYNKYLCYYITTPSYGPLLADKINAFYIDYKESFYCTVLGDMLICFYYYGKTSKGETRNMALTKREIQEDIDSIVCRYILNEVRE